MLSAVKQKYQAWKDSDISENEKMHLCGQSPLVDMEFVSKVKKTSDFMRNQPFLMSEWRDAFTSSPSGETRLHLRQVARLVCIFIFLRKMKIKVSPGPYPANKAPPEPCV